MDVRVSFCAHSSIIVIRTGVDVPVGVMGEFAGHHNTERRTHAYIHTHTQPAAPALCGRHCCRMESLRGQWWVGVLDL